jgi:type I restriction enzyme S subunit
LKYIDFDFILGADGVKILEPIDTINTKYLYYFLKANPIKNLGYARHFKELKEIDIKYPKNIRDQQKIAAKLDRLSSQTKKLETAYKNKLNKISELKTSTLEEAFSR